MISAWYWNNDVDYLNLFVLAEHLHKTVQEIQQMDFYEYIAWGEYLDIKSKRK